MLQGPLMFAILMFRFKGRPYSKVAAWLRGVVGYHICLTFGRTQEVPGSNPGAITFLTSFPISPVLCISDTVRVLATRNQLIAVPHPVYLDNSLSPGCS